MDTCFLVRIRRNVENLGGADVDKIQLLMGSPVARTVIISVCIILIAVVVYYIEKGNI